MKVFTYFVSISMLAFHTTMACTFDIENVQGRAVGDTDRAPKILNLKEYIDALGYPKELKSRGIEGKVLVKLEVSATGELLDHTVIHATSDEFAAICLSRLGELKFQPAVDDSGVEVDSSIYLPVRFELALN